MPCTDPGSLLRIDSRTATSRSGPAASRCSDRPTHLSTQRTGATRSERKLRSVREGMGRRRRRVGAGFDAIVIFGLAPNGSGVDDVGMAYIIERNDRFYVVAYDGNDPRTGKERRRWHPAGRCRADAESIAARLSAERRGTRQRPTSALTVEQFLLEVWLPRRRRELRPSTARRYQWYIDNYIAPAIGTHRLAGLR